MKRIDWIVLRRLGARVGLSVAVFFGLLCLVESLDIWRFRTLSEIGGPLLALTAIVNGAARVTMGTLPVTILIGTIIGVLDLQRRRELTVILASGISIWQVVRAPVLAALLIGSAVSFGLAPLALEVDRGLPITLTRAKTGAVWLEQQGSQGPYILHAQRALANGTELYGVSLFFRDSAERGRVEAESAKLASGRWELSNARRYQAQRVPEDFQTLTVPTTTTAGDMRIRLVSTRDLTFIEMVNILVQNVADPMLRASIITSFLGLFALPALLAGSVLIGFAFTAGYQRTNKRGATVLYGVVLGFVVYVVTELATRSGTAGVLDPAFAAMGPAFAAICIGLTVLLYKEDGRTR